MEKLDPKADGATPDIVEQNVETMKALFPDVFTEGKVDFDALRETLGDYADERQERYSFTWNGKSKARMIAQTPSTGTLRPCPEESVNWDTTQNLFIEGDNLEVLKLMQKSYHKKVKMIYIDPPYNTGQEFIYPDRFQDNLDTYLRYTGQIDDDGFKMSANSEISGRFHTNWLNMMYPRLKLARNLLRDDGTIFISIDDNEVASLRRLCDEIFGEENFIGTFLWEKRITRENRKVVSNRHDYLLCFSKDASSSERILELLPMNEDALERYKNPDNDPRGVWTSVPAIAQAGHGTKSQFYTLTTPSGRNVDPPSGSCWRYTEAKMSEAIADARIWFGADGNGVPRIKKFLSEGQQGLTVESMWWAKEVGTNDSAKRELTKLFDGKAVFETPKPTGLVERMLQLATQDEDIVLDFFAGSAPTAHATIRHDNGNKRFILVQLPEPCDPDSDLI
jgi:adenine-specific DNA-methyltransferase